MRADRPPHRPLAAFALAALAVALPAVPTFAQLIDDFDAGPFSFTCGLPGCTYSQYIGSHGIEPWRSILLWNNTIETPISADLVLTSADDGAVFGFYGGQGSNVSVGYDPPGNVDLTGGSTYEYILLRASAVSGTKVYADVTVDNGFHAVATVDIHPSGITLVPWSAFGVLTEQDLQAVDRFNFAFWNGTWFGWVPVTVWDIRLGRSTLGLWDGTTPFISWTPSGRKLSLLYDVYTGGSSPAYQMAFRPYSISGANPSATMTGFDSGGGVGASGPSAGSALFWTGAEYTTSIFDMIVELLPVGSHVISYPPDPVIVLNDGASIELRSVLGITDPTGLSGNVLESFRLDVDPAQPLLFEDAAVTPVAPGPGVAAAWQVSFKLSTTGTVDVALPLFTTMMTSDWAPAGTPTDAPVAAASPTSALSARPSITTGPTRLVLARPVDARSEISLVDVAGRVVRRLAVDRGASSVDWDGRSDSGAPLPSGVYFAAIASEANPNAARIVIRR
jgi:hypothetical protein